MAFPHTRKFELSKSVSCPLQWDKASGTVVRTEVEKIDKTPSIVQVSGHLNFVPRPSEA